MPLNINAPSRADFSPLLEKLERKMEGWMGRFISRAGKLQLIKSVLSTIPIYFMSCFKLPKWLIARINKIMRHFLWSRSANNHGIHLLNWQTVCIPLKCGGMGVTNLELQNMALLLRWLWRLYADEPKLWATYAAMLHAVRPVPGGPLILSNYGSFFWKSLLALRTLFHCSTIFRPVSGRRISFWFDKWAQQTMASTVAAVSNSRMISLYDAKNRVHQLLPAPLTSCQHKAVDTLSQFTPQQGNDTIIWTLSASGIFSVKSIYKILSEGGRERSDSAGLWKISVTPSMRIFLFLLIKNKLLTQQIMQRRKMFFQPGCILCNGTQLETATHLFLTCPYANSVWFHIFPQMRNTTTTTHQAFVKSLLGFLLIRRNHRTNVPTLLTTALWQIWRERNERIFRQNKTPPFVLANKIKQDAELCFRHCSRMINQTNLCELAN